jgi:hypothetical protein
MPGKDGGPSILTVALLGGAAYLAYEFFFASSAAAQASAPAPALPSVLPQSPGAATAPGPAPAVPVAAPPPQSAFNSLDQTYQRFVQTLSKNAGDPALTQSQGSTTATPQVFNYYLAQASSYSLPDSAIQQLFGGYPDPPVSLAAFWSAASGWLAQNKGLSGIGGRGLAGIFAGRRRA